MSEFIDNSENQPLSHERKISHMKAGYDNSQNTVRLIDTKATAVLGASTTVLGLNITAYSWAHESVLKYLDLTFYWGGLWCFIPLLSLVLVSIVVLLALLIIWSCFNCLLPRDTGKSKASVLFPFIPDKENQKLSELRQSSLQRISLIAENATTQNELEDYSSQLGRMGEILFAKFVATKKSLKLFKILLTLSVLAATSVLFMKYSYEYFSLSDLSQDVKCECNK